MTNKITTQRIPKNGQKCSKTPDLWHGLDLNWHPDLPRVIQAVVDWYQHDSEALVLGGGCGCGKTHLSKVVYKNCGGPVRILVKRCPGQWLSIKNAVFYAEADLLADIRRSYRGFSQDEDAIIKGCRYVRMLILDDVGVGYIRDVQ